jgi:hypothetical protein
MYSIISEERYFRLGKDSIRDEISPEIETPGKKVNKDYGNIRKMVLYQLKIIQTLNEYLIAKQSFQMKVKENSLHLPSITGDKVKINLSKIDVALFFLMVEASGIIKFDDNQELVNFLESSFKYYDKTNKMYNNIEKIDAEISEVRRGNAAKLKRKKEFLLEKITNGKLELLNTHGEYI